MPSLPRLAVVACALALLGACASTPEDPEGTLDRVSGGVMRVGITENPPWTVLTEESGTLQGDPTGVEPALLLRLAEQLDARIEWTEGSENEVFTALEELEVDVVIGGLHADSPYSAHATLTTEYYKDHVMAVPFGENGWLVTLEEFLVSDPALVERLLLRDVTES